MNIAPFQLLRAAKTGMMDESVTVDHMKWAHPFLELLVKGRSPRDKLWPFDVIELNMEFKRSVCACNLSHLEPTLYSLRHGGASEDVLRRRRTLEEVQRRGRWRSQTSGRRYAKEAKILSELHKVPPSLLRYGEFVEAHVMQLFSTPQTFPGYRDWLRKDVG